MPKSVIFTATKPHMHWTLSLYSCVPNYKLLTLKSVCQGWWTKPSQWTKWGKCWMGCKQWCGVRWRWSSSTRLTPMCCCSGSFSRRQRSFTFGCKVTYQSSKTGEHQQVRHSIKFSRLTRLIQCRYFIISLTIRYQCVWTSCGKQSSRVKQSAAEMWGVISAFNLAFHLSVNTEAMLCAVSSPLMFNV